MGCEGAVFARIARIHLCRRIQLSQLCGYRAYKITLPPGDSNPLIRSSLLTTKKRLLCRRLSEFGEKELDVVLVQNVSKQVST